MSDSDESSSDREYKTNPISDIADAIPLLGQVKGAFHYANGNVDGGNKAMYQSTRPLSRIWGRFVGRSAGSVGASVGAACATAVTDILASVVMNEPQGIIQSAANIYKDFAAGRNPFGSIGSAALTIGLDIVGSLGTEENIVREVVQTTGLQVAKQILSSQRGRKARKRTGEKTNAESVKRAKVEGEQEEREERANEEEEEKSATFGTNSGSLQPPTTEEQNQ